ncbi:hypothetical protein BG011_010130 [Mortierella polycephala]|uniref:Uncharacterized protein n=1 Tax=Mortierella polycephala TaxID=41804 RepID=A0A9P6PLU7_9FUNG|nr:hypothetical protein BG011_010130 [Mortierella polycephala]
MSHSSIIELGDMSAVLMDYEPSSDLSSTAGARPIQSTPLKAHDELFLHVAPLPHESPSDALTRDHYLSARDIDAIAYNLELNYEQRERMPRKCRPVDLQHHIQKELMRRVHIGIDIGIPPRQEAPHHRQFLLRDTPFTFEIRGAASIDSGHGDDKHPHGSGKYAFK